MASSFQCLNVHIIFSTANRVPSISPDRKGDLHAYIGGVIRRLGADPIIVGGVEDHVHILAKVRATHSPSDLIREVKKASSAWMSSSFVWQGGFAVLSVSQSDVDRLYNYIANQEEHHRRISSKDEFRAFLEEAGIPFEDRFLD